MASVHVVDRAEDARCGTAVASVVDLFCGAGGLTHGFRIEGFSVEAGIDLDPACKFPYEKNNKAVFVQADIEQISGAEVARLFAPGRPKILVGCAPCQPFSTYNQKGRGSAKYALVNKFADLIVESEPDVVSMENVPQLAEFGGGALLTEFERTLTEARYTVTRRIVDVSEYG